MVHSTLWFRLSCLLLYVLAQVPMSSYIARYAARAQASEKGEGLLGCKVFPRMLIKHVQELQLSAYFECSMHV